MHLALTVGLGRRAGLRLGGRRLRGVVLVVQLQERTNSSISRVYNDLIVAHQQGLIATSGARYGLWFSLSHCKILLHDVWICLILCNQEFAVFFFSLAALFSAVCLSPRRGNQTRQRHSSRVITGLRDVLYAENPPVGFGLFVHLKGTDSRDSPRLSVSSAITSRSGVSS